MGDVQVLDKPTQGDGEPGTATTVAKNGTVITVTRDAEGKVVDEVHRDAAGYVTAQLGTAPVPAHVTSDGDIPAGEVTITVDRVDYHRPVSEKQLKAAAKAAGIELPESS